MKKLLLVLLASISLSSFGQIVQVTTSSTNENCGHSNGTVTATPTGGSCGFYTYMWNTLPQQATQTVTGLHAGTYTVTVVCGTDSAISSATVTNIPGPSVSILSITNSSCGLANGSAAANAIGGTAPYNYQWSDGQTSPVILNIAAGVYTVTLTDANNCTSTANATISTTPAPILTTSTTPETCGMANGTVSANASGGSGWYAFAWSNGETVPFATGLTMGTYTVSVSDSICTTTATCNVMEIPGPTAGFSMVADSITPHHYYIINNAAGIPPLTYLWSWGDGTYDSTAFPSHTYSSAGYYIICLTITDSTGTGCATTFCDSTNLQKSTNSIISVQVIPQGPTGINEHEIAGQINIFPNPATEKLTIESPQQSTIRILNIQGQLLETFITNGAKTNVDHVGYSSYVVDISAFHSGVYIIEVRNGNGILTKRFVKE